jgi:hypothetical protein
MQPARRGVAHRFTTVGPNPNLSFRRMPNNVMHLSETPSGTTVQGRKDAQSIAWAAGEYKMGRRSIDSWLPTGTDCGAAIRMCLAANRWLHWNATS